MIKEEVVAAVRASLGRVLKEDFYLLRVSANERAITHRLAIYLEAHFPEYHVDCEYNRDGVGPKVLYELTANMQEVLPDDDNASTVFPDVIVHRRGTDDNLLVIEAKKTNFRGDDFDERKLNLYKEQLHYKYAFKIVFPVGKDFARCEVDDMIQEI